MTIPSPGVDVHADRSRSGLWRVFVRPRLLHKGRAIVLIVSAITVIGVAAVTSLLVRTVDPLPNGTSGNPSDPYGDHPVFITLPHNPQSYLGVYADGVPRAYTPVQSFATITKTHPNIAVYYSGWSEPFQVAFAMQAANHHATPLVQIEPGKTSIAAIAAGSYDAYLASFANAVASYGARTGRAVIISFGHEPNGTWYPWGYRHVAPATWVAAWRHIVTVFRRQGADNVTWLWTINIIRAGDIPNPAPWWPGNSYVTWVGIDGYYYKSSWSFAPLFGPTIKAVRALTLDPILVSETGVAPAAGQSAKIADLFAGIRAYQLLGFVWFDADRARAWRIGSQAASAAYHQGAESYRLSP